MIRRSKVIVSIGRWILLTDVGEYAFRSIDAGYCASEFG
jgi:hypothetical protein